MFKFFPHTEEDLQAMMEKAGVERLDDLYAQIPETIRFRGDYQLPSEMSELEVRDLFEKLGSQNIRQKSPRAPYIISLSIRV